MRYEYLDVTWIGMLLLGFISKFLKKSLNTFEEEIILFGTKDASFGKQVEIILKKVCYIDMPTMWELDLTSENPIVFTAQEEMNEIYKNRFLDNHNGVGGFIHFFCRRG